MTNPVTIPQLRSYLDRIQSILTSNTKSAEPKKLPSADIFDKLPSELRLEILNLLPTASALALKSASWTMLKTPLSWKQKLASDMPWLWEFRDIEIDLCKSETINYQLYRIFSELEEKSRYSDKPANCIPGLVNRRRIWGVCERIRSLYVGKVEAGKVEIG